VEVFGVAVALLALFVGFGLLIGVLFGFFGMGGSFLVTPALLVMGYPERVAVGSGLAFVFGTAVIATMKHRDLGQVDYKLGVAMIAGTTLGIEVGKEGLLLLESMGLAGSVVSVVYVALLGGIGLFVTSEALSDDEGGGGIGHDVDASGDGADETAAFADHEVPAVARKIQQYRVPPMLSLRGGVTVSLWPILAVGFVTGLLSGFLGVGGGFIRMPALFYLLGVPVPVAVGTDLFEIVFSGGIGSFLWAQSGGVDLSVVAPLLAGSALGARLGSAATGVVEEGEIKIYFGLMLVGGAVAVALREIGLVFDIGAFGTVSFVLIMGSALVVSGAIVYSSVVGLREQAVAESTHSE
jgi:hypothetical protein